MDRMTHSVNNNTPFQQICGNPSWSEHKAKEEENISVTTYITTSNDKTYSLFIACLFVCCCFLLFFCVCVWGGFVCFLGVYIYKPFFFFFFVWGGGMGTGLLVFIFFFHDV